MKLRFRSLAYLLVIVIAGSSNAWHAANDDADFALRAEGHDHHTHQERLRSAVPHSRNSHCALCHWLQAFRTSWAERATVQFSPAALVHFPLAILTVPRVVARLQLPPRAPPA